MKAKLQDGFEFDVDTNALDDMRLIRLLGKIDKEPYLLDTIACKLIGEEGVERLYDHLDVDGRVPTTAFSDAITQIIASAGDTKKKS